MFPIEHRTRTNYRLDNRAKSILEKHQSLFKAIKKLDGKIRVVALGGKSVYQPLLVGHDIAATEHVAPRLRECRIGTTAAPETSGGSATVSQPPAPGRWVPLPVIGYIKHTTLALASLRRGTQSLGTAIQQWRPPQSASSARRERPIEH